VAARLGESAIFVQADITKEADVLAAIETTVATWGAVHIGINCAGIAPAEKTVGRKGPHSLDVFQKVIDVNLVGSFNVLRLLADQMNKQEAISDHNHKGVVINTASVAAFEGQMGQAAYAASKSGVVGMTLPVARDLAKVGVRVNTIAPGIMETPMLLGLPENVQQELAQTVTYPKRLGKSEEFASMAIELIQNEYVNGTVIRLDAALRMQ
jgi:NAD(P)-dependent dehydrogenase (short-subunit alcohol dehydrogenase family)